MKWAHFRNYEIFRKKSCADCFSCKPTRVDKLYGADYLYCLRLISDACGYLQRLQTVFDLMLYEKSDLNFEKVN